LSDSSDSSDFDKSNKSEDLKEQQFRKEIEQYNKIMAKAHEIVENNC
jgi:hypothetical protein